MDNQDTNFNYKIIFAALCAVILGILIAFYFSHTQSKREISFLEDEKEVLVQDLKIMKADVDRLSALEEVYDYELQDSRYRVQQLLDSVGKLNFTVSKLREYRTELRRLQAKNDSLKVKNDFLNYSKMQLTEKFEASQREIQRIKNANAALTEAETFLRDQQKKINEELKTKKYLELEFAEGSAFRFRNGKLLKTNKASTVKRLEGTVVIAADASMANTKKIIYFQFVRPNMGIIEDNANTIIVNGNPYSKRVEVDFDGNSTEVTAYITVPEGSLESGPYILNVFEDSRLLVTSEFNLK